MEMKNPPHPGELIGDTLDELDVSVTDAASSLGITRQQLHNLIAGRSGITPEMAVRLEKAIGSTADTWLRMQMNYDLAEVRKRTISVKRLARPSLVRWTGRSSGRGQKKSPGAKAGA
jgi:addiction module HigA family antidote